MSKRRVAVTGIGVLSALGPDRESFWNGLSAGRSGIRGMKTVPEGTVRFTQGAEVNGYTAATHFSEKQLTFLDPFTQFALVAAREAILDSGLDISERVSDGAVVTGSCVGGQTTMDEAFVELYKKALPRVNPMMIPRVMGNAAASYISMEFGLTGPAYNVSTACSSSNHALGQAYWMVADGRVSFAIAGGSEAVFSYGFLKAWEAMRVVSTDTCRPFSLGRRGLILGEGAAFLVLEPLDDARARAAPVYGEIAGFGMSSDAHHVTQPSDSGAALAMRLALEDAGIPAEAIGYVNAHGTGTAANDATETRAIRRALGQHADRIAVSSTKSMHGHTLGAAGAMEAAATLMALREGLIPPTANYTEPDPECDLDVVPNEPRRADVEYALSNSFAFGGLNAVLVLRRV